MFSILFPPVFVAVSLTAFYLIFKTQKEQDKERKKRDKLINSIFDDSPDAHDRETAEKARKVCLYLDNIEFSINSINFYPTFIHVIIDTNVGILSELFFMSKKDIRIKCPVNSVKNAMINAIVCAN